jgi:hypothetical protein
VDRFYIGYISPAAPFLPGDTIYGVLTARVAAASGVATQERAPTSDDAVAGDWSGSAGSRYQLVDDYPDVSGADYLAHGITAGNITFGFTPFSVPAGAQVHRVQVWGFSAEPVSGTNNWRGRVKVGGTYYNAASWESNSPNSTLWKRGISRFATNPKTGVAWTVDDVNGVGANALEMFGLYSTDANPLFHVSSVMLQVVYSVAYSGVDYIDLDLDPNATGTYVPPVLGDALIENIENLIVAVVVPLDGDPTQECYLYPSQDGKIYHGSIAGGGIDPPQVGDIIKPIDVYWPYLWDVVTEVGDGWIKTGQYETYGRVIWVGGEYIEIRRGTSWGFGYVYPWDPSLVPLRYMKFNVRIMALDGELFEVAGYEQPYRKNVKMKLLLREEIPEE